MKKVLILLVVFLSTATMVQAQGKFGIKAGLNFSDFKPSTDIQGIIKSSTGFHAGIAYQVKVPFIGLSMQPELLYSQKNFEETVDNQVNKYSIDYAEIPINLQWGINLLVVRPFVFASPYVSYAISKGGNFAGVAWDNLNRLDYGVGLGAGVELWKLQISGKYNWSMKELDNNGNLGFGNAKFNGFQLSVAVLF